MVELSSGDMVYYSPHHATGILIDKFIDPDGETIWNYALRSPTRSNLTYHLVSIKQVAESLMIEAIGNGRFQYYCANDKQNT